MSANPNHHNFPAGTPSPDAFEQAQRHAVALELAREQEDAAKAAKNNLVSERVASRRGRRVKPAQVPAEAPSA